MRTFEYRLYPKKEQQHLLMRCLIETRGLYNEMLAMLKAQYEQDGTFPRKYDLEAAFKGRGGEEAGVPDVGFPRFKTPNRWHSMQLRQYQTDFALAPDGKHLLVPKKLGSLIKIKLHRPLEGTPKTAHFIIEKTPFSYGGGKKGFLRKSPRKEAMYGSTYSGC